jgi:uncharacterized protein (DUF2344 family)
MDDKEKEKLEKELSDALTEGEMKRIDPAQGAREQLNPRYEIRIRAEKDPIVEETRKIREMAEEVDDRYDDYLSRAEKTTKNSGAGY